MVIIMGLLDMFAALLLCFTLVGLSHLLPWGLVLTVVILMIIKGLISLIQLT
jgi:hypothetical protein